MYVFNQVLKQKKEEKSSFSPITGITFCLKVIIEFGIQLF